MQVEQWAEQIMHQINQAAILYHRLILVVAPSGSGKTKVLQEVAKRTGGRYINVSLDLSRQLLDFTERQRTLQISRVLSDIVGKDNEQADLLDNTASALRCLAQAGPAAVPPGVVTTDNRGGCLEWHD
jgi:hypothetical protein